MGGDIDTDHVVLLFVPTDIAAHMSALNWPLSSDKTGDMAHCIDEDVGWSPDALELGDMDVREPSEAQRQRYGESDDTPRIGKFIRKVTMTRPIDGYPAFDTNRPAPSIFRERPEEEFFNGFFAVWHKPSNRDAYCRPVRIYEVFRLLGVDTERMRPWVVLNGQHIVARARAAPGIQAITTVLQVFLKAELTFQGSYGYVPLLVADPAPAIVLPLPSEQAWIDATNEDPSLREIREALENDTPPRLQLVREKGYLGPLRNNQLETINGCVYY